MVKYKKNITDFMYCPSLPEANFLNNTGGAIQALEVDDLMPYCLVNEDLPLILPQRQDEGTSGVGEGINETVVLEGQFSIGAGAIVNQSIEFLMIPKIGGDVVTTYTATEVFTVVCEADDTSSLNNTYFEFDVQLDDFSIKKYFVWMNVAGGGGVPTPVVPYGGARTAAVVAFAEDATAQTVSDAVTAVLDGLVDVSAANGGGATPTITITLDNAGAVDDAHDYDTGWVITVTTQGRTKVVTTFDAESYEMQNFGFQLQRNNASYDTIYTLTGCSIAEHTLQCENDGKMTEDISYMVAGLKEQYGALGMIAKMRDAYGVLWTKGYSPKGNSSIVKNHGWHTVNENFTITLNSAPCLLTWMGFKIAVVNSLSHDRDGGGDFPSAVNLNKRVLTFTAHVMLEDDQLYEAMRQHWTGYAGDLLLQMKSMQAGDNNVYIQFDMDKGRILPFDEVIKADGSPEEYDINIVPAPGSTFLYTQEGYNSNEYFGGHKAA